jgi:uncharacterized protein (DUF2267 family)
MQARQFVDEVARVLRCDQRRADAIVLVVFQELRDRLTPTEASDLAAQLPRELRTLWKEGENPDRTVSGIHSAEFMSRVRQRAVLPDDAEAERAVLAVFGALQKLLGSPTGQEGEAWDVLTQLPKDLKKVWLRAAAERQERDAGA